MGAGREATGSVVCVETVTGEDVRHDAPPPLPPPPPPPALPPPVPHPQISPRPLLRPREMVMAEKAKAPVRVGFYDIEKTIGKGNFAVVKLARHRITKSEVSVTLADLPYP